MKERARYSANTDDELSLNLFLATLQTLIQWTKRCQKHFHFPATQTDGVGLPPGREYCIAFMFACNVCAMCSIIVYHNFCTICAPICVCVRLPALTSRLFHCPLSIFKRMQRLFYARNEGGEVANAIVLFCHVSEPKVAYWFCVIFTIFFFCLFVGETATTKSKMCIYLGMFVRLFFLINIRFVDYMGWYAMHKSFIHNEQRPTK